MLEHEGYLISKRRPGSRRSIIFDDSIRGLVMDVKLPDLAWVRIRPDQVKSAVRKRPDARAPGVDEVLAISSEPVSVQESSQEDSADDMFGDDVAGGTA